MPFHLCTSTSLTVFEYEKKYLQIKIIKYWY